MWCGFLIVFGHEIADWVYFGFSDGIPIFPPGKNASVSEERMDVLWNLSRIHASIRERQLRWWVWANSQVSPPEFHVHASSPPSNSHLSTCPRGITPILQDRSTGISTPRIRCPMYVLRRSSIICHSLVIHTLLQGLKYQWLWLLMRDPIYKITWALFHSQLDCDLKACHVYTRDVNLVEAASCKGIKYAWSSLSTKLSDCRLIMPSASRSWFRGYCLYIAGLGRDAGVGIKWRSILHAGRRSPREYSVRPCMIM